MYKLMNTRMTWRGVEVDSSQQMYCIRMVKYDLNLTWGMTLPMSAAGARDKETDKLDKNWMINDAEGRWQVRQCRHRQTAGVGSTQSVSK